MASDLERQPGPSLCRRFGAGLALLMALGPTPGCYRGGERDKDPPPGLPGGLCLAPDGHCQAGQCNRERNFCFDPSDPCDGFFCGGEDRGLCFPDPQTLQPTCTCEVGYNNTQYDLYCCPDPGVDFDPNCTMSAPSGGGGSAGADESTG